MKRKTRLQATGTLFILLAIVLIYNFAVFSVETASGSKFPRFYLNFSERGFSRCLFDDINWPVRVFNYLLYDFLGWTAFLVPLLFFIIGVSLFKRQTKKLKRRRLIYVWGLGELALLIYFFNFVSFVLISDRIKAGKLADIFAKYLAKIGGTAFIVLFFLYSFFSFLLFVRHSNWIIFFKVLVKNGKKIVSALANLIQQNLSAKRLTDEKKLRSDLKKAETASPKLITETLNDLKPQANATDNTVFNISAATPVNGEFEIISIKEFDSTKLNFTLNSNAFSYNRTYSIDEGEIQNIAEKIIKIYETWNINLLYSGHTKGPHLIRFEYKLPQSISLKEVEKYSEELSFRMGGVKTSTQLPVPGTNHIGIYLERTQPDLLGMAEYLSELGSRPEEIPVLLGVSMDGTPLWQDATAFPHLLVAGATGTGKSVFLNTFIINLIAVAQTKPLNLILVDPKRVEFSPYDRIPQLAAPILTESEDVTAFLAETEKLMERRYQTVSKSQVRNIQEYNTQNEIPIPYLFIIIDELADLLLQDQGKTIKSSIVRIAQKSRAVGIHLIVATQRPSSDIIDGLIKANFPSRIAFKTAGKVDSRIILDESGAELLMGKGDMLERTVSGNVNRLQGIYIGIEEIQKVLS